MTDLNLREIGLLVPLVVFMVWIGIRSADFTRYSEQWVATALETSQEKARMVSDMDAKAWTEQDASQSDSATADQQATAVPPSISSLQVANP